VSSQFFDWVVIFAVPLQRLLQRSVAAAGELSAQLLLDFGNPIGRWFGFAASEF